MQPQSFDAFQKNSYFSGLDGLRALSILLVLFFHTARVPGSFAILWENGRYGVSFFFAISGFLICTLLLREEQKNGRIALGKFYGRRMLRLLPLYYAALLLQAVLVFGFHLYAPENEMLFRKVLPSYLFYYSNWIPGGGEAPFFCAWSLAAEEQFYLGFGLLLWGVPRRAWLIGAIAGALLLKFAVYETFGNVDVHSTTWRVLFSYQEAILWGVLLGFALHHRAIYDVVAALLRSGWTVLGLGAAAATWLMTHPMESQSTWDAELLFLLMTAILAGVVIRPGVAFLGGPVMSHIGRISYGIYLLHMFVISAVRKLPAGQNPWVYFLLATIIVIAIASVVYRWFEQPIIQFYKRRFAPTATAQPVQPLAATATPFPVTERPAPAPQSVPPSPSVDENIGVA